MTDRTRYAIVPVEPTEDMLLSGNNHAVAGGFASGIYATMLAAAPEPDDALVERVARAIVSSLGEKYDTLVWEVQRSWRGPARAAIAAIRGEP